MTIFILGGSILQIPAIRLAKDRGWYVAVADARSDIPGVSLANRFFQVDLKDTQGLLFAAKKLKEEQGLDGVITVGTDFSESVAFVAHALGLPGHTREAAHKASNKLAMRRALQEEGVLIPLFQPIQSKDCGKLEIDLPVVVKPVDNMGARGCSLVRNSSEFETAVEAALYCSRSGQAIVEEYIEGPEFSLDALIQGDKVLLRGIADRYIGFLPYFVELGHSIPSAASSQVLQEVESVFRAGIKALRLDHGAAKGDIKFCRRRRKAVVGEIAARLSGGFMSGWTYPYSSGVDVISEALDLACGLPWKPSTELQLYSAEKAIISIPGKVHSILGLRTAEQLPKIKAVFCRVGIVSPLVFPSNNVEKAGNIISQSIDRTGAIAAVETALKQIIIRLVAPNQTTTDFLRMNSPIQESTDYPPLAYALTARQRDMLNALPAYSSTTGNPRDCFFPFPESADMVGKDWAERSFTESSELARDIFLRNHPEGIIKSVIPNGVFWRSLARGGAQGALYVLDSEGGNSQ